MSVSACRLSIAAALLLAFVGAPSQTRASEPETAARAEQEADHVFAGEVLRAGDRAPLAGASVLIIPEAEDAELGPSDASTLDEDVDPAWLLRAEVDEAGRYTIRGPRSARARLVVNAPGHTRVDQIIAAEGDSSETRLYLYPEGDSSYRTTVRARAGPPPPTLSRPMTREELETAPGTLGDPLRAVQNMPGFMRTPAGLGALVIRGSAPWQSQVFFAEHPIPRAFHVLALASVIPAAAVERIDYTPSNFASRYGNASGGVVAIQPRALSSGSLSGVHGYGELSLIGLGASASGPVGDGAFLAAARTGFYDAVIAFINAIDAGPVLLPGYFDYQAAVEQRLAGGGRLTARLLGAGDRIKPPNVEGAASFQRDFSAHFHRVDLVYRRRLGPTSVMISPAFRFDAERLSVDAATVEQDVRRDYNILFRAELTHRLSRRARLLVGTDLQVTPYTLSLADSDFVVFTPPSDDLVDPRPSGLESRIGLYLEPTLELGPLTVIPGARVSAFSLDQEYAFAVDPRLRARLELPAGWAARAAVGVYSRGQHEVQSGAYFGQEPGASNFFEDGGRIPIPSAYYQLFDPTTLLGGPRLRLGIERAIQTSAGVEFRPSRAWTIDLTAFYLQRRFPPFSTATRLSRSTVRTRGGELSIRRHLVGSLYGWLSYSLQWSDVLNERAGAESELITSIYDQRHNLNLALSYRLPRGWRIGGRFRVASGLAFTPIIGAVTINGFPFGPLHIPLSGAPQSERFPTFHQLDLRVDKQWLLDRARVSAYLDIQNVYNAQNIELFAYRADYRARAGVPGLPVLPAIGVRVDY